MNKLNVFYLIGILVLSSCKNPNAGPSHRLTSGQRAKFAEAYFYPDSFNVDIFRYKQLVEQRTYFYERTDSFLLRGKEHQYADGPSYFETIQVTFATPDNQEFKTSVTAAVEDYSYGWKGGSLIFDMGEGGHKLWVMQSQVSSLVGTTQTLVPNFEPVKILYNINSGLERITYNDSSNIWVFYK